MNRKLLYTLGIGIAAFVAVTWLFPAKKAPTVPVTPQKPEVHLPERPDYDAQVRPEADPRAQRRSSELGPGPDAKRIDVPAEVEQLQAALDKRTPPPADGPVTVAPTPDGMKELTQLKREALSACQEGLPKGTMPRQVRLQVDQDGRVSHLTASMGSGWEDGLLDCVADALSDVTVENPTSGSIVLHLRLPAI